MRQKNREAIEAVSAGVTKWVQDVAILLELFEHLLGECHLSAEAPADLHKIVKNLPPAVRQARAQKPTTEVLNKWIRELLARAADGSAGE